MATGVCTGKLPRRKVVTLGGRVGFPDSTCMSRRVRRGIMYYSEAEAVFVGPSAPNLPTYLPTVTPATSMTD